jgi:hypothetical protein
MDRRGVIDRPVVRTVAVLGGAAAVAQGIDRRRDGRRDERGERHDDRRDPRP